ncbi:hypothetical protein [Sphingomonas sp. ABOLH]|uniref:hypothetical protein n=1 Tax=Sphingomonas sp. ABOLH TaxID=1985881 RepID=UPI000F7D85E6|nr:hypothetical protein [Sphingomonas sp. ABOLH]RSV29453.1 hypothetical protein CA237_09295 [Sphingomonas sp. ABOLH]
MLHGFGQAPVCLELDLDSYDGPWTHVERFRGQSGWLVVAEAQVSTADTDWTTTLVAACDDYGEPVPYFMAPNLLACACSHPQPCREYPPDLLDHLLNKAAHELQLGWLRENNVGLLNLSRAGTERVASLEAATRAAVDDADRRIADLRRRRRMPGVSPHAIDIFDGAITAIEVDRETALHRLADQRAQVRRAVEEEELALLRRSRVRVTWEPLYHVSWTAAGRVGEDELAVRDHVANSRHRAGAFAHNERQGRHEDAIARTSLLIAHPKRVANEYAAATVAAAPSSSSSGTASSVKASPVGREQKDHSKLIRRVKTLAAQVDALHSNRLPIGRGYLIRMVGLRREVATALSVLDLSDGVTEPEGAALAEAERRLLGVETMLSNSPRSQTQSSQPSKPAIAPAASVRAVTATAPKPAPTVVACATTSPVMATVSTAPRTNAKLKFERDLLARQLAELDATGRKFLRGSPKFERNHAQRTDLAERIRALDVEITGHCAAAVVEPSLEDQRAELQAELRRHEQRGARSSDGAYRYREYRDGRLTLLGRIAEIEARIARRAARENRISIGGVPSENER